MLLDPEFFYKKNSLYEKQWSFLVLKFCVIGSIYCVIENKKSVIGSNKFVCLKNKVFLKTKIVLLKTIFMLIKQWLFYWTNFILSEIMFVYEHLFLIPIFVFVPKFVLLKQCLIEQESL